MKTVDVTTSGVVADGKTCCSDILIKLFAEHPSDTVFFFPKGRYFLSKSVRVQCANSITLRGDNAILITHFDACEHPSHYNDAFNFENCQNLRVEGFTCTTDNFVNIAGKVIAVDTARYTYDVKIDNSFSLTGKEHLYGSNTCDDEGSPDYVFDTYDPIKTETYIDEKGNTAEKIIGVIYTLLRDNVLRVQRPQGEDLSKLRVGHRILYRCLIYGNAVFRFCGCNEVVLKDIEIERCTSVGAHIFPRSSNFTFENFHIRSPKGDAALYAGNADAIHILGLCGYLKMKNCTFVGLGDDALNIHSTAGNMQSISLDQKRMVCRRKNGDFMPVNWAQTGDDIIVYDKNTFLEKARLRIRDFLGDDTYEIDVVSGAPQAGDVVANAAYFASVHLENCEVRHSRARGFLLQTRNVLVEKCRFYGMALPAVLVSPDIRYWYEVGPSDNVEIRDCAFEKCAFVHKGANRGMIVVKGSHDDDLQAYPAGVHTNLRITNNTFKNTVGSAVFVSATDGVTICGNTFAECSKGAWRETDNYDVVLHNTNNAVLADNNCERANALLYADNCRFVDKRG